MTEQNSHSKTSVQATGYFSLKTQFENVGDALINRELVRGIADTMPVKVDLSRCPPAFVETLHLSSTHNVAVVTSSLALFSSLLFERMRGRAAYYFLSPGGYVGEKSGLATVTAQLNSFFLALLYLLGVRICHLGVSYERIGPFHTKILRQRSRLLHAHYVRDAASLQYAESIGLRIDGLMPDLAFGAARKMATSTTRTAIAFSFRTDQSHTQKARAAAWVAGLNALLPPDISFVFVIQVQRDKAFMEELAAFTGARQRTVVIGSADIEACLSAYQNCSHILGNRLHALILGSLAGAIPVATIDSAANMKILGLFQTLDVNQNIFSLSEDLHIGLASEAIISGGLSAVNVQREKQQLKLVFEEISGKKE